MQRPEQVGGAATTRMPLGVSLPAGVVLAVTVLFAGGNPGLSPAVRVLELNLALDQQ